MATRKAGGGVAVVVTGIPEIDRKLKTLEPRVQKKVLRRSMRQGLKIVQQAARDNAPIKTGQTRAAIKVRAGRRSRNSITFEVVVGKGDYKGDQFYAAFQEYGSKHQPARPFMRPAFDEKGEPAKQITLTALLAGTLREVSEN